MANSISPLGNTVRKTFSPYFNARWQNYQNIVTDATFFADMPKSWITYQNVYVRQWSEWARGFVLTLHRADFFSTGIGKAIVDIMTRECIKGGFRFDGKNREVNEFCKAWGDRYDFHTIISQGFYQANRLGNCVLRLNVKSGAGEVWASVHGIDRTYFEIDRKGDITKARFLDYICSGTDNNRDYYAVEDRVVRNGVAYYKIQVNEQSGTITSPVWNTISNIKNIKGELKDRFEDLYGDIEPNRWYKLPLKTIGCWNWKGTEVSSAVSDMNGLGESCLATSLDILYSIDYNYSQAQLDQYWGRTRVGVPRELQPQTVSVIREGHSMKEVLQQIEEAPLKDDVFLLLPSNGLINDKPIQPMFMQPQIRGIERAQIRDADLELLSMKVGLSTTTLASHLRYSSSKTATEVEAENDTTDETVGNKRRLADIPINKCLKEVLDFYDLEAEVDITWNTSGRLQGKSREQVADEFQKGLMPLEEAIKRLHPELTQDEIEVWVSKLNATQEAEQKFFNLGV